MSLLRNENELVSDIDKMLIYNMLNHIYIGGSGQPIDQSKLICDGNKIIYTGDLRINPNIRNTIVTLELPGIIIEEVKGSYSCYDCPKLRSLRGAPKKVEGAFDCSCCISLETLEGAPEVTGRGFYCSGCENLISLQGGPEKVGGSFICSYCRHLKTLNNAPKEIGRDFYCDFCDELINPIITSNICGGTFIH